MSTDTQIARDVIRIPTGISNAYLVGTQDRWCLIDTGTGGYASKIREIAQERFGRDARPESILLTHGHFDHSGSAEELARMWDVPVYAHRLELPYVTGKSKYPPPDPTVGGFMSQVIRLFPNRVYDLGNCVHELNVSQPPGLQGWQVLETPGHTPGHVSFYRAEDGVLLAGDAFTTIDQDTISGVISKKPQVCRPPAYYTIDWVKAHESVRKLASLEPRVLAAGHGEPMASDEARHQLWNLANDFPAPRHGRYVSEPPVTNEEGVVYLPPPAPDPVKKVMIATAIAITAGAVFTTLMRKTEWGAGDRTSEESEPESQPDWEDRSSQFRSTRSA